MSKRNLYFLLVLAAIFYGANFHFARYVVHELPVNTLASIRFGIASVLLFFAMLFFEGFNWPLIKSKLWTMTWLGVVGVFAFIILFFIGMRTSSPVNGALINALNPLLTIVISRFVLSTLITRNQLIGLAVSFLGVIAVISQGDLSVLSTLSFVEGDIYLFAATLSFAIFNVYYRKELPDFPAMTATFFTTASATVLFFILAAFEPSVKPLTELGLVPWLCILGLSLLGTVLAYIFWNMGLAGLGGDKASVFMNIVPFSTVLISFMLGDSLTWFQVLGGALILFGVFLSSRVRSQP